MLPALLLSIPAAQPAPSRAPQAVPALERAVRGRIVAAEPGAPVEGVTCELWTEDFERPGRRVETVLTDAGGRYEVHVAFAEECKLRLRHPGYASTTISADDDELVYLYPRREPF